MTLGWNLCLCNENLVTDGAMLTLGLAGRRTGSRNSRIDGLGVGSLIDFSLLAHVAAVTLTGAGLRALFRAGGRSRYRPIAPVVAQRGNHFQAGENCTALLALRTGRITGLGAGGGLLRHVNPGVAGGTDRFGLGCIANCAGVGLDTGVLTGGGSGHLALIPLVAQRIDGLTGF